ncbi:MAG: hypothetical protein AB7O24_17810 [Kofleriaceae bacterium]
MGTPIDLSLDWTGDCEQEKELRIGTVSPVEAVERCAHRPFKATVRCIEGTCTIAPSAEIDSSQPKVSVTPKTTGTVTIQVTFTADGDEVVRQAALRVAKPDRLELACDTSTDPPALPKTTFTVYARAWAQGSQLELGANADVRVAGVAEPCTRTTGIEYECPGPPAPAPIEVHAKLDDAEASLRGTSKLGRCIAD